MSSAATLQNVLEKFGAEILTNLNLMKNVLKEFPSKCHTHET
jgi:hypothetical protein